MYFYYKFIDINTINHISNLNLFLNPVFPFPFALLLNLFPPFEIFLSILETRLSSKSSSSTTIFFTFLSNSSFNS